MKCGKLGERTPSEEPHLPIEQESTLGQLQSIIAALSWIATDQEYISLTSELIEAANKTCRLAVDQHQTMMGANNEG